MSGFFIFLGLIWLGNDIIKAARIISGTYISSIVKHNERTINGLPSTFYDGSTCNA